MAWLRVLGTAGTGLAVPRSRGAGLAGLDFGAEPSRRAGRQARRGLTRGHVLEAHGQRPRSRPETDDDRHLHDRSRGLRRHDAPDPGSLVRGEHLGEVTDLGPDAIRRPADGLPQRPRACQYLHDHLGELPGQRGGLPRTPGPHCPAPQRPGAPCSGRCQWWRGRPGWSGEGRRLAADVRVGRGRRARHRARGAVGLAVVRRPACGNRDEPQPGGGGRLGRGALAGGGWTRGGAWPEEQAARAGCAGRGRPAGQA